MQSREHIKNLQLRQQFQNFGLKRLVNIHNSVININDNNESISTIIRNEQFVIIFENIFVVHVVKKKMQKLLVYCNLLLCKHY